VGFSIVSLAALRLGSGLSVPNPNLVRPPGAGADFLMRCIRCGECIKVCPTGVLQPAMFEQGLEGLWTPTLNARLGYCDYGCTACGQVCPTGAIQKLALGDKRKLVIGTAYIDHNRCIPWVDSRDCIVCEEVCPVPHKAIVLEAAEVKDAAGQLSTVKRPRVVRSQCIGCGICEYKCPVVGEAAIRIFATNSLISRAEVAY
jgi:MauM/NapG family ferredoxin protein